MRSLGALLVSVALVLVGAATATAQVTPTATPTPTPVATPTPTTTPAPKPSLALKLAQPAVRYGAAHALTGTLSAPDGTPLAGQEIVLEGKRYPFQGSFRELGRTTTDAKGAFSFKPQLDRNHRVRAVAPAQDAISATLAAYTLPSLELTFRQVEPGVVRVYQRYTVPASVKLTAPTLFYFGRSGAKVATRRVSGTTKRTSAGHFTAQATFTLPLGWRGRFRFSSCFHTSSGSGMGAPTATCPKLALRFPADD